MPHHLNKSSSSTDTMMCARQSVARFVERIGFDAIILSEQANQGRTIIEKIEAHGDVGFAVVLLTPDDVGGKAADSLRPRARQSVLLELGYFIVKLGRERVCTLAKGNLEIPTDFAGVV
jgi:predicted nucleotide-binding protein